MLKLFQITLIFGVLFMMVLAILTPDKTMSGNYTDLFSYWTDDDYYQQNFVDEMYIPLEKDKNE